MSSTMTPVLSLLDSLLSQDVSGVQSAMSTIRQELPCPIRQAYLPPEHFFEQQQDSFTIDAALVLQHLSTYLQIFPHQAAIVSSYDNSLPLHFAASLGDASIAQVVWQAVSTTASTDSVGGCEMRIAHALYSSLSLSLLCYVRNLLILPSSLRFLVSLNDSTTNFHQSHMQQFTIYTVSNCRRITQ